MIGWASRMRDRYRAWVWDDGNLVTDDWCRYCNAPCRCSSGVTRSETGKEAEQ